MRHHVWVTQLRTLDLIVDAESRDDAERLVRARLHTAAAEPWIDSATVIRVSGAEAVEDAVAHGGQRRSEQQPPPRQLWALPAAAERLGISRTTIYSLLRDGSLGSVHIGRRRFVAEDQLQHYIAQRTTLPGSSAT